MDLTTLTDAELKAELERRAKAEVERNRYQPRLAHEYTGAEKIEAFDELHELALSHWLDTANEKYENEDFSGYAREALLELLARTGDLATPAPEFGKPYQWTPAPFWKAFGDLTK